jgi:hypothetical protein
MKNYLLGAAALLAVAAPGAAHAASGYVGATWASVDVDGLGSADAYGAEGAVAFDAGNGLGFELDGAYSDGDNTDSTTGVTGHVFTRNDNYLFGGFVGVADSNSSTTWDAGLEANKYYTNWTLAGSLAYADNNDADVSGWGVNAQARYFVSDNFRLQGNVGWTSVDAGAGNDDSAVTLGAGGEYQFSSIPISLGAGYQHIEFDDANVNADAWTVALRYNFGGTTLHDRDRHGASQADISGVSSALGL